MAYPDRRRRKKRSEVEEGEGRTKVSIVGLTVENWMTALDKRTLQNFRKS